MHLRSSEGLISELVRERGWERKHAELITALALRQRSTADRDWLALAWRKVGASKDPRVRSLALIYNTGDGADAASVAAACRQVAIYSMTKAMPRFSALDLQLACTSARKSSSSLACAPTHGAWSTKGA